MRLGSSRPWPIAMEVLTGQKQMDANPLLNYFSPLIKWLKEENERNNITVGWNEGEPREFDEITSFNSFLLVIENSACSGLSPYFSSGQPMHFGAISLRLPTISFTFLSSFLNSLNALKI